MTVEITLRGAVPAGVVEHLAQYAHEPILAARLVLTVAQDPAVPLAHRAECSLDVNGTMVRAHAVAADMVTAVDLLEGKLRQNLVQHDDRVRTRHRWIGVAAEHEWRHGDLPTQRDTHFPRPPAQRELVRRKTFACEPLTPDEAAFEMDLLGHDFYLFTDSRSGKDAVVYRDREGRFAVRGEPVAQGPTAALVQLTGAAPTLSEPEARGRLDLADEPFLFYLDAESGRGRVLYVRYDGHYGLITAPKV